MLKNLKALRAEKKISQQQLADVIGVSQQSINKYENHSVEPDAATMIAIADYFNISVDYLIGHTDIKRPVEHVRKYDLNDDEADIIDMYRGLKPDERHAIQSVIKCLNKCR